MYALSKVLVLLSVALSVSAIPSHFARNAQGHNDIAARVAAPEPVAKPIEVLERRKAIPEHRRLRKRSNSGRCVVRSSSVAKLPPSSIPLPSSTTSLNLVHSSTPLPDSSTSFYIQPSSISSYIQPYSSYVASPQSSSVSGGSGLTGTLATILSETFTGDGTYYATGLGACGITNNDSQMIAAVSWLFFDTFPTYTGGNPNNNPLCGKSASVTYGGKTIQVTITDRCTACALGSLDFSPAAFNQLADPAVGRIHSISWRFV